MPFSPWDFYRVTSPAEPRQKGAGNKSMHISSMGSASLILYVTSEFRCQKPAADTYVISSKVNVGTLGFSDAFFFFFLKYINRN